MVPPYALTQAAATPINVDMRVGDSVTNTIGTIPARHRFRGETGQIVSINLTAEAGNGRMDVLTPDGRLIRQSYLSSTGSQGSAQFIDILPETGTYTVVTAFNSGYLAFDYTLSLRSAPPQQITIGEEATAQLEGPGDFAHFTFDGDAGDLLTFEVSTVGFQPSLLLLVDGPDGRLRLPPPSYAIARTSHTGTGLTTTPYRLSDEGRYHLIVFSNVTVYSSSTTLNTNKIQPTELVFDEPQAGEFTEGQDTLYFIFEAEAGEVIDVMVDTDDVIDTQLEMAYLMGETWQFNRQYTDQDGGRGFDPEVWQYLVPESGDYMLVLRPELPMQSGALVIRLQRNTEVSLDDGAKLVNDVNGLLTFEGSAGERVQVRVERPDGLGNRQIPIITIAQNNQPILHMHPAPNGYYAAEFTFTVPQDGNVVLHFHGSPGVGMSNNALRVSILSREAP